MRNEYLFFLGIIVCFFSDDDSSKPTICVSIEKDSATSIISSAISAGT